MEILEYLTTFRNEFFGGVLGFFILLFIFFSVYNKIRRIIPMKVNCWFCNQNVKVPFTLRNSWTCSLCQQYNGFDQDGNYNKRIPGQFIESLNRPIRGQSPLIPHKFTNWKGNGFCDQCNLNQELKIFQLSSFVPINEKKFDQEIEKEKKRLERIYELCPLCQKVLEQILKKTSTVTTNEKCDENDVLLQKLKLGPPPPSLPPPPPPPPIIVNNLDQRPPRPSPPLNLSFGSSSSPPPPPLSPPTSPSPPQPTTTTTFTPYYYNFSSADQFPVSTNSNYSSLLRPSSPVGYSLYAPPPPSPPQYFPQRGNFSSSSSSSLYGFPLSRRSPRWTYPVTARPTCSSNSSSISSFCRTTTFPPNFYHQQQQPRTKKDELILPQQMDNYYNHPSSYYYKSSSVASIFGGRNKNLISPPKLTSCSPSSSEFCYPSPHLMISRSSSQSSGFVSQNNFDRNSVYSEKFPSEDDFTNFRRRWRRRRLNENNKRDGICWSEDDDDDDDNNNDDDDSDTENVSLDTILDKANNKCQQQQQQQQEEFLGGNQKRKKKKNQFLDDKKNKKRKNLLFYLSLFLNLIFLLILFHKNFDFEFRIFFENFVDFVFEYFYDFLVPCENSYESLSCFSSSSAPSASSSSSRCHLTDVMWNISVI